MNALALRPNLLIAIVLALPFVAGLIAGVLP